MEKGKTPKGRISCKLFLGHAVKNCMTVIRLPDGALSEETNSVIFAGALSRRHLLCKDNLHILKPSDDGRKEQKWQFLREQV